MNWTVSDWLRRRPHGLDAYAVLGRARFDSDRQGVLQTIKDANRQLHSYQNHTDPTVADLAQAWQRAVATACDVFHDRAKLNALHAELLDQIRSAALADFGSLRKVSDARLRQWLLANDSLHPTSVDLVLEAVAKGKQADCLASLEQAFFPPPRSSAKSPVDAELRLLGDSLPSPRKPRKAKQPVRPVELVEFEDETLARRLQTSSAVSSVANGNRPHCWYCQFDDQVAGPFGHDEVEYLRFRGQIAAHTPLRAEGQQDWARADALLADLFPRPVEPARVAAPILAEAIAEPRGPAAHQPLSLPQQPADKLPTRLPVAYEPFPTIGQRRRMQLLLGAGIGMLAATIIFLLLLLLLTFGRQSGAGLAAGTGHGAGGGAGTGSGPGQGPGSGRGSSTADKGRPATTAASGKTQASQNATPKAPAEKADTANRPVSASDDNRQPPDPPAFQRLNVPPPSANQSAAATTGDGEAYSGASGGGGSDGSEFFGTRASGSKFVYIIDCSTSMSGTKFAKAKEELIASLQRLKPHQSAYVYFFSDGSYPMFSPAAAAEKKLLACNKENLKRMETWIKNFPVIGGTNPRESLLDALDLKPNAIFFLTDGGFDPTVADEVRQKNQTKVSINTICFVDAFGEPIMKQIASENRGDYRFVP